MEILKPETPLSFNIIVTSIKALTFLVFGTVFISVMAVIFWKNQTFQKIIQRLTPFINALNLDKLKKIQISPKIQAEHCSICYGSISKEVSSNCGHIFCGDCLISFWHSKKKEKISCPLCRTDINMLTAHFAHNHEDADSKKIMEDVNRYNISCSDCPTTVLQHVLGSPSSIRIFLGSLPSRRGFNSVLKGFLGTLYLLAILMYFLCPSELIPDFETIAEWAGGSMSFIYLFLYIVIIFMMVA